MRKSQDRERLEERWRDVQALSGGPFRLGAIGLHIQFSPLHAAAKARASGIRTSPARSQAFDGGANGPVDQPLSPMALIERRIEKEWGER